MGRDRSQGRRLRQKRWRGASGSESVLIPGDQLCCPLGNSIGRLGLEESRSLGSHVEVAWADGQSMVSSGIMGQDMDWGNVVKTSGVRGGGRGGAKGDPESQAPVVV